MRIDGMPKIRFRKLKNEIIFNFFGRTRRNKEIIFGPISKIEFFFPFK